MEKTRHPGIMKIAKQHYSVRVIATDPKTGKRKEIKRRHRGSVAEARELQRQIRAEIESGAPARQRLRAYARSWLITRMPNLKPSTRAKYATALDLHILPALGDYWLDAIEPSDVARWVTAQARKLAGWTVTNQLRVLRAIAKDALAEGRVGRDFCARVAAPKCHRYSEDDPNLLTAEELGALVAAIPPQWRALVLLMASTGIRFGEATGLQWGDLDEDAGIVRVRRTNWKGMALSPKTEGSWREVPLLPEVALELRGHRQRLLAAQNEGLGAGWVFPTRAGGLHKGSPLRRVIDRATARAGIGTRITAHGLRRTFNDLARRVTDRQVLQAITGHATDAMTDHYSVVRAAEKKQASAAVLRLAGVGE